MKANIKKAGKAASTSALRRPEARFGLLPKQYVEFLGKFPGATLESNRFRYGSGGATASVDEFLSTTKVFEVSKQLSDELPSYAVPIAYAVGGNLVVIDLIDKEVRSVKFWDHEINGDYEECSFLIAQDIPKFLNAIEPFDFSKIDDDVEVISVWVDPSLKEYMETEDE